MPALRLPRNFLPTSYAATLTVNPARSAFYATIAITGDISERSSVIWLHGRHLTIEHAVATRGGAELPLTATEHGNELLAFRSGTPLGAGAWTLTIQYTGMYSPGATGAFKRTVDRESYIYTQFEPTDARSVFPCFDEPDNKVPWKLVLEVPAPLIAVSNSPVLREHRVDAVTKRVEFAATKPLPTYLVAFAVGPFDVVDAGKTAGGVPVRVLTVNDRGRDGARAVATTPRLVDLAQDLLGSPFPYDKLDVIAVPGMRGAMENPGLVTCNAAVMLSGPESASKESDHTWVHVAAHEVAHQWLGDLVTMAWWDDLWLNEGFATWVEHTIAARFEPVWHDELSETEARNSALGEDRLASVHVVRAPIATTEDIPRAFDRVTYDKGASVLRMFEAYVGHEAFLRGVGEYVAQHAFRNANSTDFMSALRQTTGKDLGAAFTTFLEQPGAPEITATLKCDRGQRPRIAVSQQPDVPPGALPAATGKSWIVPVCVAFDRGGTRAETCSLLDGPTGSIALDAPACPRWMMPNVDGRGYYRNAYTASEVTILRDMAWPQLRPAERRAVMLDVSSAAMLGELPMSLALSFLPALLAAGDRFSIRAALEIPLGVNAFVPDDLRLAYEAWLRRSFGDAAHAVGLIARDDENLDVESIRGSLIDVVADIGHDPALITEALTLADNWRSLPAASRRPVIRIAAHASPIVFDRLLGEVPSERDPALRDDILSALASTRNVQQQRAALALVLDPRIDIETTVAMLFSARTEVNRVVAQQFFKDHAGAILSRLQNNDSTEGPAWLAHVFTARCRGARRDEIVDYVTRTFATMRGGERVVRRAIETMDQCIARRTRVEPAIRSWLGHP